MFGCLKGCVNDVHIWGQPCFAGARCSNIRWFVAGGDGQCVHATALSWSWYTSAVCHTRKGMHSMSNCSFSESHICLSSKRCFVIPNWRLWRIFLIHRLVLSEPFWILFKITIKDIRQKASLFSWIISRVSLSTIVIMTVPDIKRYGCWITTKMI